MQVVSEVMTTDVRTVRSSETIGPIRDLMLDGRIHSAPVLDGDGVLVGIVTSSDLVEEWAPQMGVTTVMNDAVVTVDPDTTVVDAARLMLDHRIHHLVVVGAGDVVGLVSSFDLLRALAGDVEAQQTLTVGSRQHAQPGDRIVIRGSTVGDRERHGTIVEARGADGGPPFIVHWNDDPHDEPHDVLFFPSSDAAVVPAADED
jgi:CBS domain-containing protein